MEIKCVWVSTSEWRGYYEPTNWVAGVDDTGMWEDSPCRSDVGIAELKLATDILEKNKIEFALKDCETSNVFCRHRYVCVNDSDIQKSIELFLENKIYLGTKLLYLREI